MTRPILVIGQSHIAAIRAAAKLRREADPERPRTRVIHLGEPHYAPEIVADDSAFTPPLAATIRDQVDRHHPRIVSCIGGNAHNAIGLLRHPRPFDFRFDASDPLDPEAEPLPLAAVRATLHQAMGRDLLRLRLLVAQVGPVLHLESPPPLLDDRLIADRADPFFREAGITPQLVAPAALRLRLWRLHGHIMRAACAEFGATFLSVPPSVLTPDGYLDPALAGDATHGNARYGEHMIRMIEDLP
jgi:hypothetical protein